MPASKKLEQRRQWVERRHQGPDPGPWYEVRRSEGEASRPEVLIYDFIDPFWGVSAKQFRQDLNALGDVEEIDLRVNCLGGDISEGFAILNALVEHPAQIIGYNDGIAASMGTVVLMACDEIHMADNSDFMIHNPWAITWGEADELRQAASRLDRDKDRSIRAYQRHSSLSTEEISELMDSETWMSAEEAQEYGFVGEIYETLGQAVACALRPVDDAELLFESVPSFLAAMPDEEDEEDEDEVDEEEEETEAEEEEETEEEEEEEDEEEEAGRSSARLLSRHVRPSERKMEREALAALSGPARQRRLSHLEKRQPYSWLAPKAQQRVAKAAGQLGSRLTPAMRRAGAVEVAERLALAQLSGSSDVLADPIEVGGQDTSLYDAFSAVLAAVPPFEALGAGEMAGKDDAAATPTSAGVDEARRRELRAKYPGTFKR